MCTAHNSDPPGSAEGGAREVKLPGLKREEHGAPHGELLAPVGRGVAGEHQRVLNLLQHLVGDLGTVELFLCHVQLCYVEA